MNVDPVEQRPLSTTSKRARWWMLRRLASLQEKQEIKMSTTGTGTSRPLSTSRALPCATSATSLNKKRGQKCARIHLRFLMFSSHAHSCRNETWQPVSSLKAFASGSMESMYNSEPEHAVPMVMTRLVFGWRSQADTKAASFLSPNAVATAFSTNVGKYFRCCNFGCKGGRGQATICGPTSSTHRRGRRFLRPSARSRHKGILNTFMGGELSSIGGVVF